MGRHPVRDIREQFGNAASAIQETGNRILVALVVIAGLLLMLVAK